MTPPSPNEESLGLVPTNRDRDFVPRVSYRDDPDENDDDDDDDDDDHDRGERVLPLHARHETHHTSRSSTLWQRLVCAARITIVVSIVGTLLVTGKSPFHVGEIRDESGAPAEHDLITTSASPRDEIRAVQISNYRAGKALLLNVHITHHAGTTFCDAMKQVGPAPAFACMRDDRDRDEWPPSLDHHRPWTRDETDGNAIALRKVYHFLSWEFGILPPTPLKDVDWESPHLVSVILMRDPLERRLAADATVEKYFGEEESRTEEQWWEFAEYEGSVNFVLTRLTPDRCGEKGEDATEACLEEGKELLRRFTYILDVQCLDEGIIALSGELGLPRPHVKKGNANDALHQMTTRERIANDEIYDFIVKRNRRDIELYEWSKGLSLVKCSDLTSSSVDYDLLDVDDNADDLEIGNVSETEQPTPPPTPAKYPYEDTSKHNAIRAMQIHNYKLGRALLLNVHITHHGGTTVCNAMKQLGHAPEGACNRGDDWPETVPKYRPWEYDETDENAKALRNVYHFISWEFGIIPPTPLKDVKWESPNLVSFIVMKDPIDRRLSGDATTSKLFGEEADRTEEQWEAFAKYDGSINFMLTRLTPDHCGEEGENATKSCLEQGKELLRRFTFILDIQCLEEGLEELAHELGLPTPDVNKGRGRTSVSARERIGNDDVYDFIVERNRLDLELYEWSKSLSLVNCSALDEGDFDDDLNVTDAGDVDQFSNAINYNYTLNATDYSDDKFDAEDDNVFNNQSDSKSTNEESGSEMSLASNNITDIDNANIDDRASIRALQIENYKKGEALLLNIHITHHAGTTFCAAMKYIGNTPEHACNNGDDWPESVTQDRPWEYNETDRNAIELRKVYHFISWEFGKKPRSPLEDVNWESPHLVSVIVMKDPIDRRLSGDGGINRMFGKEEERTEEQWEAFAKYDGSINFMLTRLTPDRCGTAGENTTEECLETGKELLRRFTYILDVRCLDEGLEALAGELGFSLPYLNKDSGRTQVSARERIGNDELYELILRRNQRDLELYEWSKGLSLVNCSALEDENSDSAGNGGGDEFVDENGTDIFTNFNETHDFDDEFSAEDYSVYNNETGSKETSDLVGEKSSQDIVVVTNNNTENNRSNNHEDVRLLQIENYKKGNALLLNIHITHHAGTTFCAAMKQIGNTPSNACNGGDDWPETVPQHRPWEYNETDRNAIELRKVYHFISWEFGIKPSIPLEDTNWESPHLVSVIVMKNPIDRRLSGDGTILKKFGKEEYRSEEQWWEFAKYDGSINFMLTRLTPDHCGEDGENATDACLEEGKDLLRRFTYILDVRCLDEGLEALAGELGFSLPAVRKSSGKTSVTARERIGNDDIYNFIVERNRRDLELYEWSKSLSLVNCSALEEE